MNRERTETYLRLLAEFDPAVAALPSASPVPGQLAGLCERVGIPDHGVTAPRRRLELQQGGQVPARPVDT